MINLKNRTEYSFRFAYGRIADVIATNNIAKVAAITDRGGTWGHVPFDKACKKAGVDPIFGVELCMVKDAFLREKQANNYVTFLAKNGEGLKEIYELVTIATENFYYEPRIGYSTLKTASDNVIILAGDSPIWSLVPKRDNIYAELSPASAKNTIKEAEKVGIYCVAVGDNYYPTPEDHNAYEMVCGKNATSKSTPQHIISEDDWLRSWDKSGRECSASHQTYEIARQCAGVTLAKSVMVVPEKTQTLRQFCVRAAPGRKIDLTDKAYKSRLDHELKMIKEKGYEDYFHVVADLCQYAKQHMLVGPARGSSCGSLVCYLLGITDIDPIEYDLLFERFIDINRMDLPDIDIDFQDDKREMVFEYARDKYGSENVARLGTVSRFKPKAIIVDVSKACGIPEWEVKELKDTMIERKPGDARASNCFEDTITQSAAAQKVLAKHPELSICAEIEGHARHTGKHAAAIIITANPVHWYCSVNEQTGTAQIDKYDAEYLDLLKIDALGLRTLSVIQDALDQIGWTRDDLLAQKTDQQDAIDVLANHQFAGIFQFEGDSLKQLCKQMKVERFDDLVAITALARPGPLSSGGAAEFVKRRTGKSKVKHIHPLMKEITGFTYGIIVYQEQVMQIARKVGLMNWPDVSALRKGMGKTLGKEFFDKYKDKFCLGAVENGISVENANQLWLSMNAMGLWAFNRSHAVAYGMISYWCCLLKVKFPLEFAVACLRNAKDDEQVINTLRELVSEGYEYKPYDKDKSLANWTVDNGKLIGGLVSIKGVGLKMAADIIERRDTEGKKLTPRHINLLENGTTPFDTVFETDKLWGHLKKEPGKYAIVSHLYNTDQITSDSHGEFTIIAKIVSKSQRDLNEATAIDRRGGRVIGGATKYLNIIVEDDTGTLLVSVDRYNYDRIGLKLEDANVGDYYIWKGLNKKGFRKISIKRYKLLTGEEDYENK